MPISGIDKELLRYFSQLDEAQKKSLLEMLKTFLGSETQEKEQTNIEEYNRELEEAMKRIDAGEFYTHEEVVEMSKAWLNEK